MATDNPFDVLNSTTKAAEKLLNIEYGNTKQDRLEQQAAQKRSSMNGNLAANEYDFLTLNPNATNEDVALYKEQSAIRENRNKLEQLFTKRVLATKEPTTLVDDASDVVNALSQGTIAIGETAYGMADLASRYNLGSQAYKLATGKETTSLDELVGGAEFFQGLRESTDAAYKSDYEKAIDDKRERYGAVETQFSEEQKTKDIASGDSELWAEAKNIARQAGNTASSLYENPSQIVLGAIEELPSLLTGGLIGKKAVAALSANVAKESGERFLKSDAAKDLIQTIQDEAGTKILAKELGQKAADKFLRTDAGKKAAKKAATNAGVGTAAIEEAMSNAMQTKAEVLKLTEEDIKDEPVYKAFRDQGMTHEKALQETSQRAFDIVTALVLPTAGVISKVTGAGALEGRVFLKGSALANTITSKLGATGIEAVEEGLQSGTGQTFQNIAAQQTFEQKRGTTTGVGAAIGEGAVIGAGTGTVLGSVGLTGEVFNSASKDTKKLIVEADKAIKAGAIALGRATDSKAVKAARKSGDASVITNTETETYNPEEAFTTLASEEFFPVPRQASEGVEAETPEAFKVRTDAYSKQLDTHVDKQTAVVQELLAKQSNNEKADPVLKEQISKGLATLKNMRMTQQGLNGVLGKTNFDDVIKELKAKPENKDILLGSMKGGVDSALSIQQAEQVLKTASLSNVERKQVEAFIQTKKSSQEVSDVVRKGDKNNLGLAQYNQLINDAVNTGNTENARTLLTQLGNFAKSQVDKAKQARQAINEVKGSDDPKASKDISGKSWKLNITKRSPDTLVTNIEKDAQEIVNTYKSLFDYSTAKFGAGTQEEVSNESSDIRGQDRGSNVSGTTNTAGGQQSDIVSGQNQSTESTDDRLTRGTDTTGGENGTSVSGRDGNDNAVTPAKTRGGRNAAANTVVQAASALESFELDITDDTADTPESNQGLSERLNTLIDTVLAVDTAKYSDNVKRIQTTFKNLQANPTLTDGREVDLARAMVREIRQTDESTLDLFGANPTPTGEVEQVTTTATQEEVASETETNTITSETSNENTQQSSNAEQNASQQSQEQEQAQTTTDEAESGTTEAERIANAKLAEEMGKASTGILATGRAYLNRLTTLFKIKVLDNKINKTTDLFNELDSLEGVTAEQRVALERIGKFKEVMAAAIDKIVGMKPELDGANPYAAVDKNMIQLLMKDGSTNYSEGLDPNVLNLMAIAGLKWVATRGKESLNRTPADIAAMLGLTESSMSDEVLDYYLLKGIPSYLISDNIGKDVVKALGLSLDKLNAPRETKDRMSQSIGGVVFAALHEMGLLESELAENVPNVNGEYVNDSFESNQEGNGKQLRMTKMIDKPVTQAAVGLFNQVEDVLEGITSIENEFKMPSLEAPSETVTKTQRGTQDLTKSQLSALKNYAQKAFNLDNNVMVMFDLVGDKVLKFAMGYDFSLLEDKNGKLSSKTTHVTKLKGAKGKNNQIERSIENLKAFKQHLIENGTNGIESNFFFESVVDSNNRFRINNKVVNPQGDKLHRAAIVMDGWAYTVDDERSRTLHLLAVGQSLDVGIDKLEIGDAVAQTMDKLNNPDIAGAIEALRILRSGTQMTDKETQVQQRRVAKGVKAGGAGSHSLEGLISMMDYSETLPFESTLSIEIDGITNGTALATLLFAQDGSADVLAKSGIFSDEKRSYGKYITNPDNLDNYETLADALTAELNAVIAGTWTDSKDEPFDPKLVGLLRPIGNILGKLKKEGDDTYGLIRKIAKNPVLIGNYGAGDNKITAEFVEEVLSKVYDHIQQAVADKDQARLDLLHRELSATVKFLPKLTLANGLTWTMNDKQTSIFKTRVKQTFGKIMNSALEKQFAPLREARDNFNTMLNASNAFFRAAYAVESGKIIADKGFLTVADEEFLERKLAKFKPEIKHAQVQAGDKRSTHIPLNTTELRVNRKARFATEIDFKETPANHPDNKARQVFSPEREHTSNGVKGTVFSVQSTDSAVMADTLQEDYPVLNIYDAVIVNPMNALQAAMVLNASTVNLSKGTKLYKDTAESLKKIMDNFTNEKNPNYEAYMTELQTGKYLENEVLPTGAAPDMNPMDMVREAMAQTNAVETRRKVMFDNIQYTVQYNFEYAGHDTTPEERGSEYHVQNFVQEVKGSNINSLGSTPNSGNTSYSGTVTEHEVKAGNITTLMTMLSKISGVKSSVAHAAYLAELLGDTYNSFVATTKLKVAQGGKLNAGDYNLSTGDVRVATKASGRTSPFEMGADEVFAHEMSHSMTVAGLSTNSLFSREVRRLFEQAKKALTVTDFMEAGGTLAEAEEKYNYIFNNPDTINGYAAGVFEFVAFGLTNEKFRQILRDKVDPNSNPYDTDTSFLGKLRAVYSRLLDMLTNQVNGTKNLAADAKLNTLVGQMMAHEAAAKQKVYTASITEKVEKGITSGLVTYIQQPLVEFLSRDAFTKDIETNNRAVNAVATVGQGLVAVGRISIRGEFGEFRKVINKVAKRLGATENNLILAMMNEMQGRTAETNKFYELTRESRKVLDQARADISANVKTHVKRQFKRDLTSDEEQALTKVLVKTDMSSLTAGFNAEQIYKLITDSKFLAQEISKAESDLNQFGLDANWYKKMGNSLANFMVTGEFTEKFALKNAHAISRLVGLDKNVPKHAEQAEAAIDKLTSLRALQILGQENAPDMKLVVDLFNEEFAGQGNPENNGIMFTLMYHMDYKERALEQLFAGNKMQTVKGYTREIYNPNKSFQVAPEADVNLMAKDGFVRVGAVAKDPADPNSLPMAMYISDMGQLAPWQAGGISLASMTAKGSKYYDTVANTTASNNMNPTSTVANTIKNRKAQAARDIYSGKTVAVARTTLVPIIDETGQVTDFHYLMKEKTKDILERNLRLSDVLGSMEANMKSKVSGKEINEKYVDALVQDYKDNYTAKREEYSFVGLNSDRKDLEELYKMMPLEMRQSIKNGTGQEGIWVRDDIIKLVFGQRKFSVAHYFKEKAQLQESNTKMGNMYLNNVYRKLGSPRVAKLEAGWQETVAWIKDTIVIKSVVTLLGNVASNNILLWSMGVPIKDIVVNQERAVRYAEQYQKTADRILEIDRELAVTAKKQDTLLNKNTIKKLNIEKTNLQDKQVTNPIHGLIEAGIYQSIIDDVDALNDGFNYKTRVEEWVSPVTDKIPQQLKTLTGYVTLSQDNKVYQLLRRSTQLSDFAARFALHEHNLKKGMDSQDSINMIVDVFIDYDLPTHKGIEYLNSIGGVFFTKFFLRVQKIILHTLKNSPARFFGLHYLQELFGNISDIFDSFGLTKDLGFMFKSPIGALGGITDMHPVINMIR